MPSEIVGEFGTPGADSEWIEAEGSDLARARIGSVPRDWIDVGRPIPRSTVELH